MQQAGAELRKPLTDAEIDALAEQWDKDEPEDPDDEEVIRRKRMEQGGGFQIPAGLGTGKPAPDSMRKMMAAGRLELLER